MKSNKGWFKKGHKPCPNAFKKGDKHTKETKKKMSKNNAHYWKGKKQSEESNIQRSKKLRGRISPMKNKHHSKKTISKIKKGNLGKKRSDITKTKCRISKIKYLERCKINNEILHPTIGKNETKILNQIEEVYDCEIIRQYPIKNLGYFVDGYIKELNLVIEVDERPKNKERDIRREKEIIKELNCKFIRVKDYN